MSPTEQRRPRYAIDTNVEIDWESGARPAATMLRNYHRAGLVELVAADVLATERETDWPSDGLVELPGVFVLGHSRLDHAVLATDDAADTLDWLLRTIHPRSGGASPRTERNDRRDAMHVWTAIRHGTDGFITSDKEVLRAAPAIAATFAGFKILDPEAAIEEIEKRRQSFEGHHETPP